MAWHQIVGSLIFWIALIASGALYAAKRRWYPVAYLISIALYVYAVVFIIDSFDVPKEGVLLLLALSTVVMIGMGYWLSRAETRSRGPGLKYGIIIPLAAALIIVLASAVGLPQAVSIQNGSVVVTPSPEMPSLAKGLVAYYPEEGTHEDVAGGHDGMESHGPSGFVPGIIGDAARFSNVGYDRSDSSDDTRVHSNLPGADRWDETTISAWYRFDQTPYAGVLFGIQEEDRWSSRVVTRMEDNRVMINTGTGEPETSVTTLSEMSLPINEWHHIVVVWTLDEQLLYIDGLLADSDPVRETGERTNEFWWGAWFNGYGTAARVDEIGVWDRALTPAEIRALHNGGKGLAFPFN